MFGLGGVLTEALGDVVFGVAPLTDREAEGLLDVVRGAALLGQFRGAPAVDRPALVAIIQAVGRMALDHPEIREIDVNPVLIDGSRPVAVDALVAIGEPAPARPAPPAGVCWRTWTPSSVPRAWRWWGRRPIPPSGAA